MIGKFNIILQQTLNVLKKYFTNIIFVTIITNEIHTEMNTQ